MKKMKVNLPNNEYNIFIDQGLLNNIGEYIKDVYNGNKIAIVTDKNVDKYYGEIVEKELKRKGFEVCKIVINPGEKSKSMETLIELYNSLLDFQINRGNLIIALGGGVVGDLTGFCASTLLRGIPYIQIPTSLLAQVDSSIGGKVAIDLPRGKNLIGSFYHPKAVYIDPLVLSTLDKRFLSDGLGEVIKYGLIKDKELFKNLENIKDIQELFNNLEEIIYNCCDIKRKIVEADEKDTGERMILNFGHTIGHGIEKIQNYEGLTHGEAVAVGMYLITLRCEKLGITKTGVSSRIKSMLIKFNLPYEVEVNNWNELISSMTMDKKSIGSNINLVFIKDIGEGFVHKMPINKINSFFQI